MEKPILFSTPMVRAIREGRKTQTRRVIKPQPQKLLLYSEGFNFWYESNNYNITKYKCPWKIGDHLWVRETFIPNYFDDGRPGFKADWSGFATDILPEPKWKPSIFMSKKYARIWLEVTNIRVGRVQDITKEDSIREGVMSYTDGSPIKTFKNLWDSINEKRGYRWGTNPWVWVIEFKIIEK